MIKYFIILLTILSGCTLNEVASAKDKDKTLTLFSTKCTLHPLGQHAEFIQGNHSIKACWIKDNGIVWMLYEDGDKEQIPEIIFTWK